MSMVLYTSPNFLKQLFVIAKSVSEWKNDICVIYLKYVYPKRRITSIGKHY